MAVKSLIRQQAGWAGQSGRKPNGRRALVTERRGPQCSEDTRCVGRAQPGR
jgi:hypothetical protein